MARENHEPPNFRAFHKSLTAELKSAKDRVRNLIQDRHWQTNGEHKEAVLRSAIRRHLPNSMIMGTGFIVAQDEVSTQIDILIIDGQIPVLFREGDLMIVTPDAVRAAIEVKTRLQTTQYAKAVKKLRRIAVMCDPDQGECVWTGLFAYENGSLDDAAILKPLACSESGTHGCVHCVTAGANRFVRYWDNEAGTPQPMETPFWRSYEIHDLAPSYFVGNLMAELAGGSHDHEYAWFPKIGGKEAHRGWQIQVGSEEPEECHGQW